MLNEKGGVCACMYLRYVFVEEVDSILKQRPFTAAFHEQWKPATVQHTCTYIIIDINTPYNRIIRTCIIHVHV